MIAFHKRKFPTTLRHEGGGRNFRMERGGVASTWKKLRKQKLAKRSSHEETSPPPPHKEKNDFFRGRPKGLLCPPVFNTINTHSGEYAAIPLNIVPSNTISINFVYKINIFANFFLQNCSKIYSKTHQIAPFFKIFSGEHAPEPP